MGETATVRTPQKRRGKQREWKAAFLEALLEIGTISGAAKKVGVGRATVYDAMQGDEDFALAVHDIEETATDEIEREAIKRAINGDTTLIIFLLKCRRSEKYRDISRHELTGRDGERLSIADIVHAGL